MIIQMPLKKSDAERLRQRALDMLRQADDMEQTPALSVGDVLDAYEAEAAHLTKDERRTVLACHAHLRKHLGGMAAAELSKARLEWYARTRRSETTPRGTHPTPLSVNAELKRLAVALGHAVDTRRLAGNPIRKLPLLPVDRKKRAPWGEHELRRILARSPADWWSVCLLARWELGGRPGETVKLKWSDVSLERGTINYRREDVKTKRSRTIPLTQRLVETLKSWRKATPADVYLFTNPRTQRPYTGGYCLKLWNRAVEDSGLERSPEWCTTWHSVRAIANNSMKRRGVDIVDRMLLIGHCTLAATDTYSDASEEDLREAVDRIEQGAMREARRPPKRAAQQFAQRVLKRKHGS